MNEDANDYFARLDAAIEREEKATQKLKKIAEELAKECHPIWHCGDSDGGYVINVIKEEFYKYVSRPQKLEATSRKPIPNKVRTMVFENNAYRCVVCGDYKKLVVDHIHPVSKGGTNDLDNLQTLCWSCNALKSDKVA